MVIQDILKTKNNSPIGVFDSGVGGLTVVKELIRYLPNEDIVYYGDTARVPYGSKSRNTIIRFSEENASFLLKHNAKLIVVACNTSSSVSLPSLKRKFSVPVIGVINPGAQDGVNACRNKRLGVIGTPATIKSKAYTKEIARLDNSIKVFSKSCPLLVPVIEEGMAGTRIALDIIKYYLRPIKKQDIDTLILGCTHYPILKKQITEVMGKTITLTNSASSTARHVKKFLSQTQALSNRLSRGKLKFFVSDEIEGFRCIGERFIGKKIDYIRKVGYGI
jgi:glutamate racemase